MREGRPPGRQQTPIWRPTARLLVVDRNERVLLLSASDEKDAGKTYWFTPGGGIQPGETARAAAVRELAEETGFACTEAELGPVVATSASRFVGYDGRLFLGAHTFFFLRVPHQEIVGDGREDYELSFITGHRWWTADELRSAPDPIFPPPLPLIDLMGRLLRGDMPSPPVRLRPGRDSGSLPTGSGGNGPLSWDGRAAPRGRRPAAPRELAGRLWGEQLRENAKGAV